MGGYLNVNMEPYASCSSIFPFDRRFAFQLATIPFAIDDRVLIFRANQCGHSLVEYISTSTKQECR